MYMQPNEFYRYSLKQGMSGWDVCAIQIALNGAGFGLTEDGIFGPITTTAVREMQRRLNIIVDGICGPQTQSALCINECNRAGQHTIPNGLLKGICLGESGGIIPTTSSRYPNGSRDYGPLQNNLTNPTQQQLNLAFQPKHQAEKLSAQLNNQYKLFLGRPGAKTEEKAWRLAVLSYNWPAAAQAIANSEENTWTYVESGTGHKRSLIDSAPWVEQYHVPNVKSGIQWCIFYINSKVVYVTNWSV